MIHQSQANENKIEIDVSHSTLQFREVWLAVVTYRTKQKFLGKNDYND